MQNADAGWRCASREGGVSRRTVSFVKQYYETTGILRPANVASLAQL